MIEEKDNKQEQNQLEKSLAFLKEHDLKNEHLYSEEEFKIRYSNEEIIILVEKKN